MIRPALVHAAQRRRRERMRQEALEVAADPADLAESRRVRRELDQLGAW